MQTRRRKKRRRAQARATSWLFLIQPELLPGAFKVQPLRPHPRLLPNVVLEGICEAVHSAKELVEKQREAGAELNAPRALARTVEHLLNVTFGHLVPVEVITMDEMYERAERGDFSLRLMEEEEIVKTNKRLHRIEQGLPRRHHGNEQEKEETQTAAGL